MKRLLALALLLSVLAGCKQEEEAPPAYPAQQPGPQPSPGAAAPPPPSPTPGAVPPPSGPGASSLPPAPGFLCATDRDAQCPFGRCIGGRCGGCSTNAECKPNTQCLPTFVGQVCLPMLAPAPTVAAPAPTPTPNPTPSPSPSPTPAPAPAPVSSPFESARQLCVTRTNEYRARVGVAPVARRPDAEACGDAQARSDGASSTAHGAFGKCRERAQNECPGWDGSPESVVERCLAMMFAEGPGGGHYVNMTEGKYRGVSCGFASTPGGKLWVVQNFYP